LQERVYERVGGRETLRADVRVVCATHRDLRALVAEESSGRISTIASVVEIVLPPLRVRGEAEVLALAEHFADMLRVALRKAFAVDQRRTRARASCP